jgi:plasmid stability protein
MAITITLDDHLAAQLQARAAARNLSLEALALQILGDAVANGDDTAWHACNQRRIELIRKQFAAGLQPEEAHELQQLQTRADQHVERLDERLLGDINQLYRKAQRLVDGSSG